MLAMSNEQRDHDFVHALSPSPRTQTELSKRNRAVAYNDALIAVEWLNGVSKKNPAYARVTEIQAELEALATEINSLHAEIVSSRARLKGRQTPLSEGELLPFANRAEKREQLRKRHNLFNEKVLSRYSFRPVMAYDVVSGIWRYNAVSRKARGPIVKLTAGTVTISVGEVDVVVALARLAANRELYKVRLCQQCRARWKAVDRKMDRFCGKDCRELFRWSQEETREKHARAQREYRNRLKGHPPRNEKK